MLRNYFIVAIRYIARQRSLAFINIAGLSIGLLCGFFILLWISDEMSYDKFHRDGDRIVQLWRNMITDGQINTWPSHGQPVPEAILAEYPEVEEITWAMLSQQFVVTSGKENFRENGGFASPAFFDVLSFRFLKGDPHKALQDPSSVVITDRLARKLFGDQWASQSDIIGRSITIDHRKDFTITGILADLPENSSIQFDALLPARDLTIRLGIAQDWYYMCFSVYAKVHPGSSLQDLNQKIADLFIRHNEGEGTKLFFQPFEDVYLHSTYKDGKLAGGRIDYIRIFAMVGIFVLLIACINFMNLATARSSQRSREIGVRKVVGAPRRLLMMQFITESLVMTSFSFLLAMGLFYFLLPAFNNLTGKHVNFPDLNPLWMFAISVVVGVLSGSYPAIYLSGFRPLSALRSSVRNRSGRSGLRKGLVIFQFALSVMMIVATVGVFLQLHHIRTMDLGMQREGLLFLPLEGDMPKNFESVSQALLGLPGISSITETGQDPLNIDNNTISVGWQGKASDSHPIFFIVNAGKNYARTMRMEMAEGRDFTAAYNDSTNFLLNEAAAQLMGGSMAGKTISVYGTRGKVVGVVKNFSMNSLYSPIAPAIIRFDPQSCSMMYVRTRAGQIPEALATLESACKRINPDYPFQYTFLDQVFERTYRSEAVMGKLASIFAVISIFISCLGLLGLTAFAVEQRTKEIGIRKALGASISGITILLSSDFVKLVLTGIIIAIPAAAYFMSRWLQGFASRITMPWWLFALAGLLALLLAIATIGIQSVRAARANPVDTLRSE